MAAKIRKNPVTAIAITGILMFFYRFISPPQMRYSLIYNYLRELGVKMLQNAYKHPCSKHLTTNGKGTHFFQKRDKKTNINASE